MTLHFQFIQFLHQLIDFLFKLLKMPYTFSLFYFRVIFHRFVILLLLLPLNIYAQVDGYSKFYFN